MPLSPSECRQCGVSYTLDHFLKRGGFPEPFLAENDVDAARWRLQYVDSLLRVDILDFEKIQDLRAIRLVFELLQRKVGSTISYNSIAEDCSISPNTVKKYIQILEALYIVFRVTPFSNNIARSLLKEPKIYFFDTGLVQGGVGAKFENFVATCLLKYAYAQVDYQAVLTELHYLRTKDGHEVDFAFAVDGKIQKAIEVKHASHEICPSLRYFHEKYKFDSYQLVKDLKRERVEKGIHLMHGATFLEVLQ